MWLYIILIGLYSVTSRLLRRINISAWLTCFSNFEADAFHSDAASCTFS